MSMPAPPGDSKIGRRLAEHGEAADRYYRALVEEACAAHPDLAARLTAQFSALRAAGLLGPIGDALHGPAGRGSAWDATGPRKRRPEEGDRIGRYRLLRELGRGGQAVVYLARDDRLERPAALKVLRGVGPVSPTALRRFRREAEVTSRLDHPGICPVYEASLDGPDGYIAMRYVRGETLAARIARANVGGRPWSRGSKTARAVVRRTVEIVEKAARALHAAHEAGVIHRDIKPGNLMVTPEGDPVLLDFGLAGEEEGTLASLTRTGEALGTPAYLSPEQLAGARRRIDRRTDVYSLGVTLYECLTGRNPFHAPTREGIARAIEVKKPAGVRRLNPSVSRELQVVVETAMAREPEGRYQTALDFAEDLRRVRTGNPPAAKRIGPIARLVRYVQRRPLRAAAIASLAAGIVLLAGMGTYIVANQPRLEREREAARRAAAERHLEHGFRRLLGGDPVGAIRAFDRSLGLVNGHRLAAAGKALAHWRQGRREAAVILIERQPALADLGIALSRGTALASSEPDPASQFVEGVRLLLLEEKDEGSPERALGYFRRTVHRTREARLLYHEHYALAAARAGRSQAAAGAASALVALWPGRPEAWRTAARAVAGSDPELARERYRQALALDPKNDRVRGDLRALGTRP